MIGPFDNDLIMARPFDNDLIMARPFDNDLIMARPFDNDLIINIRPFLIISRLLPVSHYKQILPL